MKTIVGLLSIILLIYLSGCGNKIESHIIDQVATDPSTTTESISGLAAIGRPYQGKVFIKGSAGEVEQATTDSSGRYSVSVDYLTPPYLLMMDTGGSVYLSAATKRDVGLSSHVNITPLTHVIVAGTVEDANGIEVYNRFNEGIYSGRITSDALGVANDDLANSLSTTLMAFNADDVDILNDSFALDGTGMDAVLDVLDVSPSRDGSTIVVTNRVEGGTLTITTDGSVPDVIAGDFNVTSVDSTYDDYLSDLQAVEDTMNTLAAYLASANGNIENILTVDFKHQGADVTTSSNISQDLAMVLLDGDTSNSAISFSNISFISYTSNDGVIVYSVLEDGIVVGYDVMPVERVGADWLLYGNQAPIDMGIKFLLNRQTELTEGGFPATTNTITLYAWSNDFLSGYDDLSVVSDQGGDTLINAMDITGGSFSNTPLIQASVEGLTQFDKYTITLTLTDTSTVSWDQYLKVPIATYTGATLTDINNDIFPEFAITAGELCSKSNTETFIWVNPGPLMQKEIVYTRFDLTVTRALNNTDLTSGEITAATPITDTLAVSLTLEAFDSGNRSFKRVLKCNFVPAVVSSAETTDSLTIEITMDKALSGSAGDPAAFTVGGVASSPVVTGVTISGLTVTLDLSAGIVNGETVTVSYAATGTSDLTGIHGAVANFSNQAVTNNMSFDLTGVGVDVAAGNITNTATTMEYSLDSTDGSDGTWALASDTNTAVTFVAGDVYIREQANPGNFRLVATIAAPASAPSTPVIDYSAETAAAVATTIEYDTNNTFPSPTAGDGSTPIALTPGTDLYFRTKATVSALPSLVATLTVAARPTTPAYTIDYTAETTVEIVPATVEYNTDNDFSTANTDGIGATVMLTPGTDLYFRVKQAGSNFASAVQTLVVAARPTTPAYTIDYTAETTVEIVPATVEYNTDNDFSTANTDGIGATVTLTPGTDLYFRVKQAGSNFASAVQTLVVAARPTTPSYTIDYTAETTVEIVPATVEYNTDNDFSTANTDGIGATVTLTPGTDLYFRVKQAGSNFASVVQTLVVAARPTTPSYTIDYTAETTVEIVPATVEYNTDNDFSTANTDGIGATVMLTPGTDLYFRVKQAGSNFASAVQTLVVAARPTTPAYTIDYTAETTVEIVPATVEYNTDNDFSTANTDGIGATVTLTPGTDLYFRVKQAGSNFASAVQTLVVATRPTTPAYTIDYTAETTVEIVPATVEYNTDNDFSTANTDGIGATVTLTPGTDLYFRVKQAGSNFASAVQTLVVAARPTTPAYTIDYTAETTVEIVPATVEYNTDNDFSTANTDGIGATVTLTPGTDLYFRVKQAGSNFASAVQTLVVAARPTTPAYTIDYTAETTVEIVPATVEYNTDNDFSTANTDGIGATVTLTPGTDLYFRVKQAGSNFASAVQTLVVAARPTTPSYTIDYTAETTVEIVPATVEYNTDNDFSTANTDGIGATVMLTPGTDLYFRVKQAGSNFASAVQTLVVAARPTTPAYTIDYTAETTVEIVPATVEYNTDNDFSTANTDGIGATVTLTPGTDLYFRVKQAGSNFASAVQTLVVATRPTTPAYTIDYTAETTVEIVPATVEYNTDNDFSTANTDGIGATVTLTPGTDLYFRVKQAGSNFASAVQTLVVAARPAIGYAVTVDDDNSATAAILTDASPVQAAEGLEYELDAAAYTGCSNDQQVDLSGSSILYVRRAAVAGVSFASLPTADLDGT